MNDLPSVKAARSGYVKSYTDRMKRLGFVVARPLVPASKVSELLDYAEVMRFGYMLDIAENAKDGDPLLADLGGANSVVLLTAAELVAVEKRAKPDTVEEYRFHAGRMIDADAASMLPDVSEADAIRHKARVAAHGAAVKYYKRKLLALL